MIAFSTSAAVARPSTRLLVTLGGVLSFGLSIPADAGSPRTYEQLSLTPDGKRLAAIESWEANGSVVQALIVRSARDGRVLRRVDPCATCMIAEASWSPHGDRVAMLVVDEQDDTMLIQVDNDVIASFKGLADSLRWSPDGKMLSVLATANPTKQVGAIAAGAPMVGEIGTASDEHRIATVGVTGGTLRFVSPPRRYVYEYDWAPDSRKFVATTAEGSGDRNWWIASLDWIEVASGRIERIATPSTQVRSPRISSDGRHIAFVGGLMSDFEAPGGDIFIVDTDSGDIRNLTPQFAGTFTSLSWRGGAILASAMVSDKTAIVRVSVVPSTTRILWSDRVSASAAGGDFAFDASGTGAAAVVEGFNLAPRIIGGPTSQLGALTHDNDDITADVVVENILWTNEGLQLQGWLLSPRTFDRESRPPLIVHVHGGPAGAHRPTFAGGGIVASLLAKGYVVFQPNPRGSFGMGEAFTAANRGDFGRGDFRDILTGIDAVERLSTVDPERIGIIGGSYGGYMAMWAVANSKRFKAAVSAAGVANWVSYYGQNGINQWMVPYFGQTMYENPKPYWDASPIRTVASANTPTLLLVGERDVEVPSAQSLEFWNALNAVGVPTQLVIYEGEGHALRKPEHAADSVKRILDWFGAYLSK